MATLLSAHIVRGKAPKDKCESLLYLNTWLRHKAFIISLQCQPQARRPSPKRWRTNQQLLGPLFVTVVALSEHAWDMHTVKTNAHLVFYISKATLIMSVVLYQWRVSHSDWRALAWSLPRPHHFLLLPFSSGSYWRPEQRTCSLYTVHIQIKRDARPYTHDTQTTNFVCVRVSVYLLPGNFSQLLIVLDDSPEEKVSAWVPLGFSIVLPEWSWGVLLTFRQLEEKWRSVLH